jgi:hypothetical protein
VIIVEINEFIHAEGRLDEIRDEMKYNRSNEEDRVTMQLYDQLDMRLDSCIRLIGMIHNRSVE